MLEVRSATAQDRGAISTVLATAFAADPVVRWLMPNTGRDLQMFRVLTTHLHAAPGCADIALNSGDPVGAALWDPPGHHLSLGQGLVGLSKLFFVMGSGLRRGATLEHAFTRARPAGQFWYLAQIGASTPARGVGSALLGHRLASIEGPAYLESSNPRNVPFYQRFGFDVIEEISLPQDGPTLWTMLRPTP
jgi:predicted N-acetyltransferase YhbS